MRLSGIASGMDTEQMVKDLMKAERIRVDKYYRQEESLKWKQEAFNTTNKTLAEFILKARSGFGLTSTSGTGTIINKSKDSFDWVKKVSSSNESIVKATATANAMPGSHTIQVKQLASGARFTTGDLSDILNNSRFNAGENGSSFTISNGDSNTEIKLENAKVVASKAAELDFSGDNSLTFKVNGKEVKLDKDFTNNENALVQDIQAQLDKDGPSGITVKIDAGGKLEFNSVDPIVIDSSDMTDGEKPTLKITDRLGLTNGLTRGSNSIDGVVKEINNANIGLTATYDASLGKLMITSKEQGAEQEIKITGGTGGLAEILNKGSNYNAGQNAQFWFNEINPTDDTTDTDGTLIKGNYIEKSSNNFSMYGINFQLQNAKVDEVVNVNIESNVEGIMDKVKDFVTEYNTLIDSLNSLIKEKNYRDYTPLTSEEKEAMKEKEIELWEAKAKSGLLRGDESINRMLQSMRSGLYENVLDENGNKLPGFSHITQIGITTGNYQSGGKLEINEDKLRAAINDNPDGVIDLLFNKADKKVQDGEDEKSTATRVRAESGLVERIFDDMISGMKDIVRKSGTGKEADLFRSVQSNMLIDFVTKQSSISVLDKDLTSIGSRITREEQLLTSRETRYWNQFTAMEKALQKMNSQSSWLSSQLG